MSRLLRKGVMPIGGLLRGAYLWCLLGVVAFHLAGLTVAQQPFALTDMTADAQQNKHFERGLVYYGSGEHKLAAMELEQAL
ncbi:MAG: hypothetical protein DMG27_19225, partial [Acidobacteria bacterium]